MARQLKNASITHVSYVGSAANKKTFLLTKSLEKAPDFEKKFDVIIDKSDEKQLVYGVVYEPDVEDAHGDYMNSADIEKAAHEFMKEARNIDTNHDFESGVGEVVESYIAPADFEIDGETVTKGTWVMVTKASDEVWEAIKKGEITGYSMAGTAEVLEEQEKTAVEPSETESGFIEKMKNSLGEFLTKGVVRDYYERNKKRRNVFAAFSALEDSLYENNYNDIDMDQLKTDANEFVELINEISFEDLQKSKEEYKEMNEEDEEMNAEEIKAIVKQAISEGVEELKTNAESVEKEAPEVEADVEKALTAEEVKAIVAKAVTEGIEDVKGDLEELKKSTGSSKQLEDEEIKKQEEESVFGSIFSGGKE